MIVPSAEQLRQKLAKCADAIQEWREDDSQGSACIEEACNAEEALREALTLLDTLSQELELAQNTTTLWKAEMERARDRRDEAESALVALRDKNAKLRRAVDGHPSRKIIDRALAQIESSYEVSAVGPDNDGFASKLENYIHQIWKREPSVVELEAHLEGACHQRDDLRTEVAHLTEERNHRQCHDLVCNGDRKYPRGVTGHGCSCATRGKREAEQLAALTEVHERLRAAVKTYGFDALLSPREGTQQGRTIPAGIWVTVQGVPVQLSAPLEVSEKDWQRIHARMPTRHE